jgi:hypothetical protein
MSFHPGDVFQFYLNIADTGSTVVSSTPTITILNVASPATPVVTAATMTLVTNTSYVYAYGFAIPVGSPADYVAIVSYATTSPSATISNQFSSTLHVGDSFVAGPVAQDSTVAKAAIVAQQATTMQTTSYVAPMNDPTVQAIQSAVNTILTDSTAILASVGSLSASSLSGLIQDIYDASFGSVNIDQTVNPPVMYIKRINGTVIASFTLINNSSNTQRNVLTSPPESSI